MWSQISTRSLDSLSMRRITLFVSAIMMALFATLSLHTTSVQAQESSAMATWSGEKLEYSNMPGGYIKASTPPSGDPNVPNLQGTPCETSQNVYRTSMIEPIDEAEQDYLLIGVICLDNSFNGDKSKAIGATVLTYGAPSGTANAKDFVFDEEIGAGDIEVAPEGLSGLVTRAPDDTQSTSSCSSENSYGLSWIICPVTNWLAAGMDALFGILSSFLTVAPLATDRSGAIYYMWGLMQNFANILFIIGFLIIIYSQITNFGVSNYGIKRLMPRLIIAAVLVNISYWIAALSVDLSNILGVGIHDMFTDIGKKIPEAAGVDVNTKDITWSAMAGAVLTGSVAALGLGGAAAGVVASAGGSLWFLLVALVGVMISILVAILVLAARQALITILIIVSPLAFVAYLLPSTEKYFDRWRGLFMTLLLVFPIISIVFGGAQVAGLAIIYSALENPDNPNFFNLIILGMLVQVAPVVITPLLIKLSGSIVGRVAGIVNDPNKGIVDRTRKFAQNRHDLTKNRQLWALDNNGNLANNNPLAWGGRKMALREINSSHKLKAWESGANAAYEQDARAHEVYRQTALNEMRKSTGENEGKSEFAHSVARNSSLQRIDTLRRLTNEDAELADNQNKTLYEQARANPSMANVAIRDLAERADGTYDDTKKETMRLNIITQTQEGRFHERMIEDVDGQNYAGAVEIDVHGPTRVLNISQEAESKAREARVNSAISTLSRNEAKLDEERSVILGNAAGAGEYANLTGDIESRSGALRRYVSRAPIKQVQSLLEELDITVSANGNVEAETLRSELVGALQKRKPFYVSQTNLNKIEEGALGTQYRGTAGKTLMIGETLNAGGLSTEKMVTEDRDDLDAVVTYFKAGGTIDATARAELEKSLRTAFTDNRYKSRMDKRIKELGELWGELGMGPRP